MTETTDSDTTATSETIDDSYDPRDAYAVGARLAELWEQMIAKHNDILVHQQFPNLAAQLDALHTAYRSSDKLPDAVW